MGQLNATGLDLNSNGLLEAVGTDRFTETEVAFFKDESDTWWASSQTKYYRDSNSPPCVSSTRSRLTGLSAPLMAQTVTTDFFGNTTITTSAVGSTAKTRVESTDSADRTRTVRTTSRPPYWHKSVRQFLERVDVLYRRLRYRRTSNLIR